MAIETAYHFDPFGERIDAQGNPVSANPLPEVTKGYTEHEHDDDVGLINMRGRMFDPKLKRYLTPDPVVAAPLLGQAWNPYSYAMNNPIRFVDPTGMRVCNSDEGFPCDDDPGAEPGLTVPHYEFTVTASRSPGKPEVEGSRGGGADADPGRSDSTGPKGAGPTKPPEGPTPPPIRPPEESDTSVPFVPSRDPITYWFLYSDNFLSNAGEFVILSRPTWDCRRARSDYATDRSKACKPCVGLVTFTFMLGGGT